METSIISAVFLTALAAWSGYLAFRWRALDLISKLTQTASILALAGLFFVGALSNPSVQLDALPTAVPSPPPIAADIAPASHHAHRHRYRAALPHEDPLTAASHAFRTFPVKYRKPDGLAYGRPNLFVVTIASADLQAANKRLRMSGISGTDVSANVALSPRVRAVLWGADDTVKIELKTTPETHDVGVASNATWEWYVTPKSADDIDLELDLYNIVTIDGQEHQLDGPAYRDRFVVKADWMDRFMLWLGRTDPIWKWIALIAGVLGGAAGS